MTDFLYLNLQWRTADIHLSLRKMWYLFCNACGVSDGILEYGILEDNIYPYTF